MSEEPERKQERVFEPLKWTDTTGASAHIVRSNKIAGKIREFMLQHLEEPFANWKTLGNQAGNYSACSRVTAIRWLEQLSDVGEDFSIEEIRGQLYILSRRLKEGMK